MRTVTSLLGAAQQLADQLTAAGIAATVNPSAAVNLRPCVLVTPPRVDYVAGANTWQLAALAAGNLGDLAALEQLDQLVRAVVELLPIEAADPAGYTLTPEVGAVPAYLLRLTT